MLRGSFRSFRHLRYSRQHRLRTTMTFRAIHRILSQLGTACLSYPGLILPISSSMGGCGIQSSLSNLGPDPYLQPYRRRRTFPDVHSHDDSSLGITGSHAVPCLADTMHGSH